MPEIDIGARMRAARALAGFPSVEALMKTLNERGVRKMKRTVLYEIESNRRPHTSAPELREIAEACGLPLAWFTADFSRLDEISDDPRSVIARETKAAVERAAVRRANTNEETPSPRQEGQSS